ncbi:hypothetical protein LP420_00055 [Massilia sp. B-10]|nr:hypothetical protein LP420_00055 [Massilia sp. B-10]
MVQHRLQLKLRLRWLTRFSRDAIARILKIGIPAADENLCWQASFMVITYFVGQMGEKSLATFSLHDAAVDDHDDAWHRDRDRHRDHRRPPGGRGQAR